ncbi:WbuC family cupin fold metalloprotein [Denitratisoma oestradiolicum]|uniref:Cupin fold metalloprotein WbuC cupin domain-containing protein n=1 Tax=Denitratisoma oestradiolicum TaxID=311182 RepID=A0A6S6XTU2_9PROT|nr:WbuC family cupin fold metalloprotein [Denitratisoma oestradiolicum]TWO78960.1 hypothetical protein CBW56_17225 [Denitratisoma oestradiolicum]CAB1368200.1 conserved protein of unknown function [Denitratisoma oestradiolicum]
MKTLSPADLNALSAAARHSPRRRMNLNLHGDLADPVQRLAIAMEPDTLVVPHRHPQTFELLHPLRGRFVVLHFDDTGAVVARRVLGEDAAMVETPAGVWHAVLSLDPGGIIFEVKQGPYVAVTARDCPSWAPSGEGDEARALLGWFAQARVGDRWAS